MSVSPSRREPGIILRPETKGADLGMIIWPGEMEFWEQRQAAQRQLREERERQARMEAAWWRSLQQHYRQPQREDQRDGMMGWPF